MTVEAGYHPLPMGQRANLIVRATEGDELYYSHWRANTLDSDLFWGPEAATAFARAQRSVDEGAEWLDEIWAEGGAVIDHVERVVLWFGGEDVAYDVPLRRVHLALMSECWPGWEVRWAHEHITQLAAHVGRSWHDLLTAEREPVEGDFPDEPFPVPGEHDGDLGLMSAVSTRAADGTWKVLGVAGVADSLALVGPAVAAKLAATPAPAAFDYARHARALPTGCLHLDLATRRFELWVALPHPDFERRLRDAWPGWEVRWHRDRFEAVTEMLGDRLVLPFDTEASLLAQVRAIALRESRDRSGLVPQLAATPPRSAGAGEVGINPFALRDDPSPSPGPHAEIAFERLVERWRAKRRSS